LLELGFVQSELTITKNVGSVNISAGDNSVAQVGDVIMYYCNECKINKHAVIITEIDKDGYIKFTGTNSRWDNSKENVGYYNANCGHGNASQGSYSVYLMHWPK